MNKTFFPVCRLFPLFLSRGVLFLISVIVFYSFGQINARISPTAKEAIAGLCQTTDVKLVFVFNDTMRFVDFSESAPQLHTMNNVVFAYFPVVSSDGKWVTYQTGIEAEGSSTSAKVGTVWLRELAVDGASVKIADTGYVPRFAQNTSADSPEIIYSTSVACPNHICYNNGRTLKKKIVNKSPQSVQVVFGNGSYYGGLSWDGRFLVTGWPGGPNVYMLDLQDTFITPHPVHTMRVKKNIANVDTFVTIGACNISRSASTLFTNMMLFYDFSSLAIKNAGCYHPLIGNWGMHEKLFISRYDGEDMKVFDTPADRPLTPADDAQGMGEAIEKEWYYPEWSNHPYYAAASLLVDRLYSINSSWEHTYNCELVYLVNLKDSVYIKLIESSDSSLTSKASFKYPFIWVQVPAIFQEDTAWLKHTIWERAGLGVRDYNKNRKSFHSRNNFFEGKGLTSLTFYSLTGQRIATVKGPGKAKHKLENALKNVHSGTYVIGVEASGQKKEFIRWIVEK